MKAATICSGIGAPEAAHPDLGWLWHAEVDTFPAAVLAARHPTSVNLGDITADDFIERAVETGRPEILIGGTPCQSFSIAGLRKSLDDERGNLALVAVRLVHALDCAFLWENVPGVLSAAGNPLGCILGGLVDGATAIEPTGGRWTNAGVVAGPRGVAAWRVLDAQGFLAQRRERVFLLFVPARMAGRLDPCRVLFEPEADALVRLGDRAHTGPLFPLGTGVRGHPPSRREAREGIARPKGAGSPSSGGYRNDADTADNLIATPFLANGNENCNGAGIGRASDPSFPLQATISAAVAYGGNDHGGPHGRLDFESETFVAQEPVAFSCKDHGADASAELAPTLRAMTHDGSHANGGGQIAVAFAENSRAEVRLEGGDGRTVASLKTGGGKPGQSYPAMMHGASVRRLLPVECEKLMGFWPGYTAITYRGKEAADGPRYKSLGNSMAVPVLRWLLTRIEAQTAAPLSADNAA